MIFPTRWRVILPAALIVLLPARVLAQEDRYDVGLRYAVVNSGGKPAADMQSLGVFGHVPLNPHWHLGFALDEQGFDFEEPVTYVGLDGAPPPVDSTLTGIMVSGWIERRYAVAAGKRYWYWSAGIGVLPLSATDATGPLKGNTGTFDIETDPGADVVLLGAGGIAFNLSRHWRIDVGLRVDHHLANWTVVDRVSGRTGEVDSFTAPGAQFGLSYVF